MDVMDKLRDSMSTYGYSKSESEADYDFFLNDVHWNEYDKQRRNSKGRPALTVPIVKPKIITTVTALAKDAPSIQSDNQSLNEYIEHVLKVSNSPKLFHEVLESMVVKGEGYIFIGSKGDSIKLRTIESDLVYFDANTHEYDKAEYCFVLQPFHKEKYKGKAVDKYDGMYLIEYYFKDEVTTTLYVHIDGSVSDVMEGSIASEDTTVDAIKYQLLDGSGKVLEESTLEVDVLPVIPFYGRVTKYDGKPLFKGMFSDMKDTQRSYNIVRSGIAEAANTSPKAKYLVQSGSIDKHLDQWKQLNDSAQTYVEYEEGSQPPMPISNPTLPTSLTESAGMLTNDMNALVPKEQSTVSSDNAFTSATQSTVDLFTYDFQLKFRNALFDLGIGIQAYGSLMYEELSDGSISVEVGVTKQSETNKAIYTITELNRTFPQYGEYSAELLLNLLQFKGKEALLIKMEELKAKASEPTQPTVDPSISIQQTLAQAELVKSQAMMFDAETKRMQLDIQNRGLDIKEVGMANSVKQSEHEQAIAELEVQANAAQAGIKSKIDVARLDMLQQKQDLAEVMAGVNIGSKVL